MFKNPNLFLKIALLKAIFLFPLIANASKAPENKLENFYDKEIHNSLDLKDYWVGKNLDGVRAYWDGKNLISRNGSKFNAPAWFIKNFPKEYIEGELWIENRKFDKVLKIVTKKDAKESKWKKIKFMVFDAPKHPGTFDKRLGFVKKLVLKTNSQYLNLIEQFKVSDHDELEQKLQKIVKKGVEGLTLHNRLSKYNVTHNDDVLKVTPHKEGQAVVLSHIKSTRGWYKGYVESLGVKDIKSNIQFRVMEGLELDNIYNPPKIGSIIHYKYDNVTKDNKPKFASFIKSSIF